MALNKYMHSRNIYKTPPDFTKLSKLYSDFSAIAKVDVTGKTTIDFKDPYSLRVLTKCLLKSDFNLDVHIPEDRLVPTLPLRLNYILWLEDLMNAIERKDKIWGLDIGTGSCAIYPLLGAVKNKWNFVGTETDAQSFSNAEENVQKNGLQDLITLRKNFTKTIISHVFTQNNNQHFDFCMCNPPFYSTLQELCESRSPARLPPKNGFTGSPQELITEGGELKFCRQLIKESNDHKDNIVIFSTMVGHKYNLSVLIQDLNSKSIKHTHTEFCQGRVTRWGLAWTYTNHNLTNLVPPRDKARKKHTPTIYILPELSNCDNTVEVALSRVKNILDKLSITYKLIEKRGNIVTLDIVANSNTWSNQRRKRRLEKRIAADAKIPKLDIAKNVTVNNSDTSNQEDCESTLNKLDVDLSTKIIDHSSQEESKDKTLPLVHAFIKLFKKENNNLVEIEYLDGIAGKEGLHQIVQYIKNNWK